MRTPKAKYIIAVLLAIASFALQPAKADFISFINANGNPGLGPFQNEGPFIKVDINLVNSTTADVTFTSLTHTVTINGTPTPVIYLMGDGGSADLNVNGTFTVSDLTKSNSGTGFLSTHNMAGNQVGDLTAIVAAGQQVDSQGTFNLTINDFDGFTHAADTISFQLNATNGTTWANQDSVLFFNTDGFDAAAHIFPSLFPAVASNNQFGLNTGFAAENAAGVPDSGLTAMLLGIALTGLGVVRRFAIG